MSTVDRWNPAGAAPPIGRYSQLSSPRPGTRMVFVAGQVGNRPDGSFAEGAAAQTRQALANVAALGETLGAGPGDLVRLLTFLAGAQHLPGFYAARDEVYARWFPAGDYCGHSLAVVAGLAAPHVLVEVEGWFAVPAEDVAAASTPEDA